MSSKRITFSLNMNKEKEKELYDFLINDVCDPKAYIKEILFQEMKLKKCGFTKEIIKTLPEEEVKTIDDIIGVDNIEC